jgi:putative Mg2+ transporter-C (MgtC) family protein
MLVCLAAMLFVRVGEFLIAQGEHLFAATSLRMDPVRVVEAIATGVAFIGAGTVFRDRDRNVAHGLTTAASLLVVAPIGIAVATERYILAVGVTLLVFLILRVVNWIEIRTRIKQVPEPAPDYRPPPRPPRPNQQYRGNQRNREGFR